MTEPRVLEHDGAGIGDPPFVLLPGGLTGWDSWLPLVPALAEQRRVIRVQPITNAEGIAGKVGPQGYRVEVERESLARTLDEIGIEQAHLVGWSNGGRIALDFALAHPDRVLTLTAIEPAAWWLVEDSDPEARRFGEFIASCAGRELHAADVERFLAGAGFGEVDFKALPQWEFWLSCRRALTWFDEAAIASAVAGIEGFERLQPPALLIRGRSTAPWLRGVVDVLAESLPDSTVVDLDGGHACLLESPGGFVDALRSHVAG